MPRRKNKRHSSGKSRHTQDQDQAQASTEAQAKAKAQNKTQAKTKAKAQDQPQVQAQADTCHGATGHTPAAAVAMAEAAAAEATAAKGNDAQDAQGNAGTKTSSDARAASGPKGDEAEPQPKTTPVGRPSCGTEEAAPKLEVEEKFEYGPLHTDPDAMNKRVVVLEQFLLYKFKMKQPILKAEMLKVLGLRYQSHFLEMLKKASERIETLFAVRVQEVDSVTQAYDLVGDLKLPNQGRVCPGRGLPKSGLLMHVLGMIFLKGNCASEDDIWKLLGTMQVYPGRKHNIYGEPRKLLTKDLVRLQYLEYCPVPHTQPPRYQFLWGPKAHAETSKMSVLQFMAKIKGTVPSSFSPQYQEALREQAERALARRVAGSRAKVQGAAGSKAKAQGAAGSRAKVQGAAGSKAKAQGAAGSKAKAQGAAGSKAKAQGAAGSKAKAQGAAGSKAKAQGAAGSRGKAQSAAGSRAKAQGAAGSRAKAQGQPAPGPRPKP